MPTDHVIAALKAERDRLSNAIAALEGTENGRKASSNGRRPGPKPGHRRRGKRRLNAAARKRISLAAKARWAKAKGAGRNRL